MRMIVPLFFRKLVLGMMAMDGVNAANGRAQVIQAQTKRQKLRGNFASGGPDSPLYCDI